MTTDETNMQINTDGVVLEGILAVPPKAIGIVIFVHGSGSSRFSPRNTFVAKELQKAGIATLLVDLLTENEDAVYETRFDIVLLTKRLDSIIRWVERNEKTTHLPIALFGASTGAAAAFRIASQVDPYIRAVVSRGGRPDLSLDMLGTVAAPTLLIVGGNDFGVIELNQRAFDALQCEKKLEIVEGATHLFEEKGALEKVATLASNWFTKHFTPITL